MRKVRAIESRRGLEVLDEAIVEDELAGWNLVGPGDEPLLPSYLVPIFTSWNSLGSALSTIEGMAGGFIDNRSTLFLARLAWLNEYRFTTTFSRDLVLDLWESMDAEDSACTRERIEKKAKK